MASLAEVLKSMNLHSHATRDVYNASHLGLFSTLPHQISQECENHALDGKFALEHVKILFRQGCFGKAVKVLHEIREKSDLCEQGAEVSRTASLYEAASKIHTEGLLRPALIQARNAHTFLKSSNLASLSYLDVDCILVALRIFKLSHLWSSWISPTDTISPWSAPDSPPWESYLDVARILFGLDYPWESLSIINLVREVVPPLVGEAACEDLINKCADRSSSQLKLVAISASCVLCSNFTRAGKFPEARSRLESTRSLVSQLSCDEAALDTCRIGEDLQWAQALCYPDADQISSAQLAIELGNRALSREDFVKADYFFKPACEIALQCSNWDLFAIWRSKQEKFLNEDMRDLPDLILGRCRQWRFGKTNNLNTLVEWFDNTSTDSFDIPHILHSKHLALATIFSRLDKTQREKESDDTVKILQEEMPKAHWDEATDRWLDEWENRQRGDTLFPFKILLGRIQSAKARNLIDDQTLSEIMGPVELSGDDRIEVKAEKLMEFYFQDENKQHWHRRRQTLRHWLYEDFEGVQSGAVPFLMTQIQSSRMKLCTEPEEAYQEYGCFVNLSHGCTEGAEKFLAKSVQDALAFMATCKMYMIKNPNQFGLYDDLIRTHTDVLNKYISNPRFARYVDVRGLEHVRVADLCQRKRRVEGSPPPETLQHHLTQAELAFNELRVDMRAMSQADSLKEKSRISSIIMGIAQLQEVGYRVYRLEFLRNPCDLQTKINLWNWVQRSKSRAITDALGLKSRVPASIVKRIEEDPIAAEKKAAWDSLNNELQEKLSAPSSLSAAYDIYYLRKAREEKATEMRATSSLRELIEFSEGRPIQFSDLHTLFKAMKDVLQKSKGEIILVEWFEVKDIAGAYQWYLTLVKSTTTPNEYPQIQIHQIPSMAERINSWISKYLTIPDGSHQDSRNDASSGTTRDTLLSNEQTTTTAKMLANLGSNQSYDDLQSISPVISPLFGIIHDDDTVVLCPSSDMHTKRANGDVSVNLHRIPFHALEKPSEDDVEAVPLICSHDIVYCHSQSILRHSVQARAPRNATSTDIRTNDTESHPAAFFPVETTQDTILHDTLENTFPEHDPLTGSSVTHESFLSNASNASHLFFFGHVHDKTSTPLDTHLCMHERPLHRPHACASADAHIVTANDILNELSLAPGSHVSMISCASGTPHSVAADDFLGLIPAMLFAGARSTISTLFPIFENDGVDFTVAFYEAVGARRVEDPEAPVDLARCLRKAVVKMRGRKPKNLAAWAGFVFHGFGAVDLG